MKIALIRAGLVVAFVLLVVLIARGAAIGGSALLALWLIAVTVLGALWLGRELRKRP